MNNRTIDDIMPNGNRINIVKIFKKSVKDGIIFKKYCKQYIYKTGKTKKIAKAFFAFSRKVLERFFAISAILLYMTDNADIITTNLKKSTINSKTSWINLKLVNWVKLLKFTSDVAINNARRISMFIA